jgi:hypothetical protein
MRKSTACFTAIAILTGCATAPGGAQYRPIVDLKNVSYAKFVQDLNECQAYSAQAAGAAEQAAGGAAAGAIFGALLAVAGGRDYNRGSAAKIGLLSGAAAGAVNGERDQRTIIRTCLTNRGYSVLST